MTNLKNIKNFIFDCDGVLYQDLEAVFGQVSKLMTKYISEKLKIDLKKAKELQTNYFYKYNTSLNGLMIHHDIPPKEFLNYVHDIDLTSIRKNKELSNELKNYDGKKIIFTNGSDEHAKKVLNKIGLSKTVDHVFDIIKADYIPKPDILTYKKVIKEYSLNPKKTIMIDDLPNNLKTAKELGIKTVLIKKDFFNSNTYNYIDIICDNLLDTIKKINKGII